MVEIVPILSAKRFSEKVLRWFDKSGRKTLPWQQQTNAYKVWLSEVMLQQTQVATVIDYFNRFLECFPTVFDLASAELDQVLHLWSGLGYYARARNLHKAAQLVVTEYNGQFPADVSSLESLPGIGRSTAGAVVSLAFNQPAAILDGNVKRVLTRSHCVEGYPEQAAIKQSLWQLSEQLLSQSRPAAFNQAMMDIGALICTRRNPQCTQCPINKDCRAFKSGLMHQFPSPKVKKTVKPIKTLELIIICAADKVLLEKRPDKGIWGGLWSFPERLASQSLDTWLVKNNFKSLNTEVGEVFRHTFTHFHCDITPTFVRVAKPGRRVLNQQRWVTISAPGQLGLSAVGKKILARLGGKP